ncbi:GTPase Era [Luminiphilus sp.]|jgi:GTP-binding protein Era|nr:GTPase Era [Luminiphilus sp.]MBT5067689.1 GTPase Era [Halieaceae bacterium]MBT6181439.1 GTPase Era [Halieaceae bacterium]MDA8738485.1 GTPase Era [Luminiphilus sp.]MDA8754930.1 GTPase Era [Luminiphilus sp.]
MSDAADPKCGFVALVGRPNVGKSTLLNFLLEQKLSITSRKPQTTRQQVLGVKTVDADQMIFVDTPGLHRDEPKAINKAMNRSATSAMADVDLVLFLIDRGKWTEEDAWVLEKLRTVKAPVALIVNKMDLMDDPKALLPEMESLHALHDFAGVFPISALRQKNLDVLETFVRRNLPEGHHLFPEGQITNRTERFLAAELIREKIIRQLGDELPHTTAVEIEGFQPDERGTQHISAIIFVERDGQKRIVIGTGGSRLRSIGTEARRDMEKAFDSKVMLKLWVKVKSGWSDDVRALQSLGLEGES